MKKFEIEVVRTYTTTIEVELPDSLTTSEVERITCYEDVKGNEYLYEDIWDIIAEKELEQMDTDILTCKAKEL